MKERQIPFSGPMVRALLDDRKEQTRRVVTGFALKLLGPDCFTPEYVAAPENSNSPYGFAGDRLWVREAWRTTGDGGRCDDMPPRDLQPHTVWYEAAGTAPADECVGKYRPGMFMPRWASRITLEVTAVRIERLQDISEADAIAEGIVPTWPDGVPIKHDGSSDFCRKLYRDLWDSLNAERGHGWSVNPWVWVVEFKRIEQ